MKFALSMLSIALNILMYLFLVEITKHNNSDSVALLQNAKTTKNNTKFSEEIQNKVWLNMSSLGLLVASYERKLLIKPQISMVSIYFELSGEKRTKLVKINAIILKIMIAKLNESSQLGITKDFKHCERAIEALSDFKNTLSEFDEKINNTFNENYATNFTEPILKIKIDPITTLAKSINSNTNLDISCTDILEHVRFLSKILSETKGKITKEKGSIPEYVQKDIINLLKITRKITDIDDKKIKVTNCNRYSEKLLCEIEISSYAMTKWVKQLTTVPFEIDSDFYQIDLMKKEPIIDTTSGLVADSEKCQMGELGRIYCMEQLNFKKDACVSAIINGNIAEIALNCKFSKIQSDHEPLIYTDTDYHLIAKRNHELIKITVGNRENSQNPVFVYNSEDTILEFKIQGHYLTLKLKGKSHEKLKLVQTLSYSENTLRFFLKQEQLKCLENVNGFRSEKVNIFPEMRPILYQNKNILSNAQKPYVGKSSWNQKMTYFMHESWDSYNITSAVVILLFTLMFNNLSHWIYESFYREKLSKLKAIKNARLLLLEDTRLLNETPSKSPVQYEGTSINHLTRRKARKLLQQVVRDSGSMLELCAVMGYSPPKKATHLSSIAEILVANELASEARNREAYNRE